MVVFLGRTHIAMSIALYLALNKFIIIDDKPIILVVIFLILGSLIVDIDSKNSLIGRFTPFHHFLKHRGITHTLIAAIIISLPFMIYDESLGIIFLFGYLSHLLGDMMTPMGIKLFYPISNRRYSLNLIKVGSKEEQFVFVLMVLYIFTLEILTPLFKLS